MSDNNINIKSLNILANENSNILNFPKTPERAKPTWIFFVSEVRKMLKDEQTVTSYDISDSLKKSISDLKTKYNKGEKGHKQILPDCSLIWENLNLKDKKIFKLKALNNKREKKEFFYKEPINIKTKKNKEDLKKKAFGARKIRKLAKINNKNSRVSDFKRSISPFILFQKEFFREGFLNNKDISEQNRNGLKSLYDDFKSEKIHGFECQRNLGLIWRNYNQNSRYPYIKKSKELHERNSAFLSASENSNANEINNSVVHNKEALRANNHENHIGGSNTNSDNSEFEDINFIPVSGEIDAEPYPRRKNNEIKLEKNPENIFQINIKNSDLYAKEVKIKIEKSSNSKLNITLNPFPFIEKYAAEFDFEQMKADKENTLINLFGDLNSYFIHLVESLKKGELDITFNQKLNYFLIKFEAKIDFLSIPLKSQFKLDFECTKADLKNYYNAFKQKFFELDGKLNDS